jgi:alpha-glucosidase
MQLAAFFPFYRNHNDVSSISQEPYVWPSVAEATKTAMAIRFQLMPYLYTLFHDAHTMGSTVMRALAWEFPNDLSLRNADRQFFLGPAILVTPVLEQGATAVRGVFPGTGTGSSKNDTTIYYDWYTQAPVPASNGQNISIPAPLGHIPVYIRGGYILALQQPANTTAAARRTPWSLLVALDTQGNADGHLYLDDGESLDPGDAILAVTFTATANSLSVSSAGRYVDTNPLANISILGASYSSSSAKAWNVTLNGTPLDGVNVSYNATSQVLSFGGLESLTSSTAEWSGAGNGAWSKREWMLRW